jgi:hypothetical protein
MHGFSSPRQADVLGFRVRAVRQHDDLVNRTALARVRGDADALIDARTIPLQTPSSGNRRFYPTSNGMSEIFCHYKALAGKFSLYGNVKSMSRPNCFSGLVNFFLVDRGDIGRTANLVHTA